MLSRSTSREVLSTMKRCSYCAARIDDEAGKCEFCDAPQEWIAPPSVQKPLPWYLRTRVVVIALLAVMPFALPLVWWHPKLNVWWKVGITVVTLIATWYSYIWTMDALNTINEEMDTLRQSGLM